MKRLYDAAIVPNSTPLTSPVPTERDPIDIVESEFTRLARTVESVARRSNLYAGLDRASYVILRTLADGGPGAVSVIADRLGLDGSTVTRQTSALEERGLVTRTPDPEDRRASIVDLTPSGRTRVARARRHRQGLIGELFASWPSDDLDELGRVLARLNATLADSATVPRRRR